MTMTYKEAKQYFIDSMRNGDVSGQEQVDAWLESDKPALRQAWNNFTHHLRADWLITARQYDTWQNPWKEAR